MRLYHKIRIDILSAMSCKHSHGDNFYQLNKTLTLTVLLSQMRFKSPDVLNNYNCYYFLLVLLVHASEYFGNILTNAIRTENLS